MSAEAIRLKISGGPLPYEIHITDQDGRELRNVVAFTIRANAGENVPNCTLELCGVDFDLECEAVARRFGLPVPVKMTPGDLGCREQVCQQGRGDPPMDCGWPDCGCGLKVLA